MNELTCSRYDRLRLENANLRVKNKGLRTKLAEVQTELELALDAAAESPVNSPSQICAKLHIQNCHWCERADCCDNETPSIVSLKKQLTDMRVDMRRSGLGSARAQARTPNER